MATVTLQQLLGTVGCGHEQCSCLATRISCRCRCSFRSRPVLGAVGAVAELQEASREAARWQLVSSGGLSWSRGTGVHGKQQLQAPQPLGVPQPLVPGSWCVYLGLWGYSQLLSLCQGVVLSDCGVTMLRKLKQQSSGVLTRWPRPCLVMTCHPKLLIPYLRGRICRTSQL